MKLSTLFTALFIFTLVNPSQSQTTYNVTSSRTWNNSNSSPYPSSCIKCTFNISAGVTLTIDKNVTCQGCTFNGGTISMTEKTLTLQTPTNYFNNINLFTYGNSKITFSAPVVITNSKFTLYDKTEFNPQQLFEMNNSRLNLYDKSFLMATGGPVNLKNNSSIVAGNGTLSSTAYVYINGPQLNIYDVSGIVLANNNNYYFNWNSYYSGKTNTYYSTKVNNINCGGTYPHSCSMPYLYGTSSLSTAGIQNFNYLPVKLTNYEVKALANHTVALTWKTRQEENSAYFSIERSTDGLQFAPVATVNAQGNSSVITNYAYTDTKPTEGTVYYRLKMVDLDNTYLYSEIKSVHTESIKNISVYPNPTHDNVNVTVTSNAKKVLLIQATGQVMQERTVTGNSSVVSFNVQSYSAGTYMVQVINNDGSRENKTVLISR